MHREGRNSGVVCGKFLTIRSCLYVKVTWRWHLVEGSKYWEGGKGRGNNNKVVTVSSLKKPFFFIGPSYFPVHTRIYYDCSVSFDLTRLCTDEIHDGMNLELYYQWRYSKLHWCCHSSPLHASFVYIPYIAVFVACISACMYIQSNFIMIKIMMLREIL